MHHIFLVFKDFWKHLTYKSRFRKILMTLIMQRDNISLNLLQPKRVIFIDDSKYFEIPKLLLEISSHIAHFLVGIS